MVRRRDYADADAFDAALLAELDGCEADLVVLAGYLSILSKSVVSRYANRILNVHPSLIPSFCGKRATMG